MIFRNHKRLIFWVQSRSRYQASSSICLNTTVAVCTVLNSWWWMERPSETCGVVFKTNKFVKQVHPVGFTIGIYYYSRTHEHQIGHWIYFHIADDQRDFSEYCMVANSEFFTIQVCTTCYKSLVILLLAQITKCTITTVFWIDKMASSSLRVPGEGKAEVEDTQSSGIISS
jgi:hypothetical protein